MHHMSVGYRGLDIARCYKFSVVIFVATSAQMTLLSPAKMHLEGAFLTALHR